VCGGRARPINVTPHPYSTPLFIYKPYIQIYIHEYSNADDCRNLHTSPKLIVTSARAQIHSPHPSPGFLYFPSLSLSLSLTLYREPCYLYPEPVLRSLYFRSLGFHFNNITLKIHVYRSRFHLLLVLMQKFAPIHHTISALSAIAFGHNY
jgi:hypothetical protein